MTTPTTSNVPASLPTHCLAESAPSLARARPRRLTVSYLPAV